MELVEKYKVTRDVLRADRDARAEEAGPGVPEEVRPVLAAARCSSPASRSTSRRARWIADALGVPIIDNYWQTETGWPILTIANGVETTPSKFGSPGVPMYGYDVKLLDESTGAGADRRRREGRGRDRAAAAAGLHADGVGRRRALRRHLLHERAGPAWSTRTFDWGIRDEDGYYFILGRTDDVINVAGHRLGTREIEESISSHPNVAEVAVVGVADALKGQVAMAFVVAEDASALADDDGAAASSRARS